MFYIVYSVCSVLLCKDNCTIYRDTPYSMSLIKWPTYWKQATQATLPTTHKYNI